MTNTPLTLSERESVPALTQPEAKEMQQLGTQTLDNSTIEDFSRYRELWTRHIYTTERRTI